MILSSAERIHDLGHDRIGDREHDLDAPLFGSDDPLRAENLEVLRHGRLRDPERVRNERLRARLLAKTAHHLEAKRVRERLQEMGSPLKTIVQNGDHGSAFSFLSVSLFSSGPTGRLQALFAQVGTPSFGRIHTTSTTHNANPSPATAKSLKVSMSFRLSVIYYK